MRNDIYPGRRTKLLATGFAEQDGHYTNQTRRWLPFRCITGITSLIVSSKAAIHYHLTNSRRIIERGLSRWLGWFFVFVFPFSCCFGCDMHTRGNNHILRLPSFVWNYVKFYLQSLHTVHLLICYHRTTQPNSPLGQIYYIRWCRSQSVETKPVVINLIKIHPRSQVL